MGELGNSLGEKFATLAGKWTSYAALGSFLLYLFGYLALRFQLTTYGVATNLDIFDEKYLFAGCRFVVYLVSTIPNLLVLLLPLMALAYIAFRMLPKQFRERVALRLGSWCAAPLHLPLLGVVLAVALIQFVMRRSYAFGNLLLRRDLPADWISSVLLASDWMLALYFGGLLTGTAVTGVILLTVLRKRTATTAAAKFWTTTLILLLVVEFLFLPVNFGVLISTQQLPRVELTAEDKPSEGERRWLLWDTKDALTYFERDVRDQRGIVTLPKKDARVKLTGYDDIFCVLFGGNGVESRPCPRGK